MKYVSEYGLTVATNNEPHFPLVACFNPFKP
jgi:hypothetical protein